VGLTLESFRRYLQSEQSEDHYRRSTFSVYDKAAKRVGSLELSISFVRPLRAPPLEKQKEPDPANSLGSFFNSHKSRLTSSSARFVPVLAVPRAATKVFTVWGAGREWRSTPGPGQPAAAWVREPDLWRARDARPACHRPAAEGHGASLGEHALQHRRGRFQGEDRAHSKRENGRQGPIRRAAGLL
jgi:hypothetical protein